MLRNAASAALDDASLVTYVTDAPRFVLVSDLDHTMVQNEDTTHEYLMQFNALWNGCFAHDSLLIFSTGRSPELYAKLWEEAPLLTPGVLICSVGTEVFYRAADGQLHPDFMWGGLLDQGWDREGILKIASEFPQLAPQAESEQRRHKLSFHLKTSSSDEAEAVIRKLEAAISAKGLEAKVIYSGGLDLDILAQGAGKGKGLEFVLQQLKEGGKYPKEGVQVNGDSGNDVELYEVPGVRGCVVANAHPELRKFADANPGPNIFPATKPCSGGIAEALRHYQTVPPLESLPPSAKLRQLLQQVAEVQVSSWGTEDSAAASKAAVVASLPSELFSEGASIILWNAKQITVTPQKLGGSQPDDHDSKAWLDMVKIQDVAEGLWLATYRVWSLTPQGTRDLKHARHCSALLSAVPGALQFGMKVLHLQETLVADPQDGCLPPMKL